MRQFRFSMTSLLSAVAIISAGLATLNSASQIGAGLFLVATSGLLLAAILGTIYSSGERRAFWLGMALFGWFYMAIAFTSWFESGRTAMVAPLKAFRGAFWTVRVPDGADQGVLSGMDTQYDRAARQTLGQPAWHTFGPTAHCLVALLFGLAGGITGRWFCLRSGRQ